MPRPDKGEHVVTKLIVLCESCGAINRVAIDGADGRKAVCGKCSAGLNASAQVSKISESKLEKVLRYSEAPVIVDAYADWCGPCKSYAPIFEEVAHRFWKQASFFKIDTEHNAAFSHQYQIRGIPATLFFVEGKLKLNQAGLLSQEQLTQLVSQAINSR